MTVRRSTISDLAEMERIYAYAREQMKKNGNPNQWGDNMPLTEWLIKDIDESVSYVIEEDGRICGTFMFFIGEDPDYGVIEDGQWLNDERYGVIHRIASDGTKKGVLEKALAYCSSVITNLRIDTHHDNHIMQHLLDKNGFTQCGIIYVEDGSPRIAYQRG